MQKFKKFNCLILSFVLLLVSVFTVSQKVNAETIKIGVITEPGEKKTGVILRPDAGQTGRIITLSDRTVVNVYGTKNDTKGYVWYNVGYSDSNNTYSGYIREDMITVSEHTIDYAFKNQLTDFPQSYHNDLILLHSIYPNWTFKADKLNVTFAEAVALEEPYNRKQVYGKLSSDGIMENASWLSMDDGYYNWNSNTWPDSTNDGWYGASREVIAHYIDPRNFLNANDIYVYMVQTDDNKNSSNIDINNVLYGTFLLNGYNDPSDTAYNGSYTKVIFEASNQSGINPFVLGATIKQEQGVNGTSALISGARFTYQDEVYEGFYNFFNFGASGKTKQEVIRNGLLFAKEKGWNTRSQSIIEGAKRYRNRYIDVEQNTYFYKNFNFINLSNFPHQYAQNVQDSYTSAKTLRTAYSLSKDKALTFRIPVYKDNSLPEKKCSLPDVNTKKNNYYLNNITVEGLTPSFSRYNYEYALSIGGNTNIYIDLPSGASIVSNTTYDLKSGNNDNVKITVKSETGYTNDYNIKVYSVVPCTLSVKTSRDDSENNISQKYLFGDANLDGTIDSIDIAKVQMHILKIKPLSGNNFTYADANKDGTVDSIDLAKIQMHHLKIKTIKQ